MQDSGPWYTIFSYHVNRLVIDSGQGSSALSSSHIPIPSRTTSNLSVLSPPSSYSNLNSSFLNQSIASSISSPTTVTDFLRKQATAGDEFSLSIKMSNLPNDRAQLLRSFIINRMLKGTVYSGAGQIAKLALQEQNENGSSNSNLCYYCLVRNDDSSIPPGATYQSDSEGNPTDYYFSQEYVICFMAAIPNNDEEGFDLFRPDMDDYCKIIAQALFTSDREGGSVVEDEGLRSLLENWYSANLDYVTRGIGYFERLLDSLLYFILEARAINVVGDSKIALDAIKLFKATNILQVSNLRKPLYCYYQSADQIPEEELQPFEPKPILLTVRPNSVSLSQTVSNPLCQEWGNKLLEIYEEYKRTNKGKIEIFSPSIELRKTIELYKMKAMHEVNTLKKQVRKAEVDHYSLYGCFQFLQGNANKDILLNVLRHDFVMLDDATEATEVLDVISYFILEISHSSNGAGM